MLLTSFLEDSAKQYPDRDAVIFEGQHWTYRLINKATIILARELIDRGFSRGSRALVYMENSPQAIIVIFSILRAGGVVVPIHHTVKVERLTYILNDCAAVALFAEQSHENTISAVWANTASLREVWLRGVRTDREVPQGKMRSLDTVLDGPESSAPAEQRIDLDLALLMYTSGSTGIPKGVMLTHANALSASTSIMQYLENSASDIVYTALPLSFGYGLFQVVVAFQAGAAILLDRSFIQPHATLRYLTEQRATGFPAVPSMFSLMKRLDRGQFVFPTIRYVTNAGAAIPISYLPLLHRWFPSARIYFMYGQTECVRISYLSPDMVGVRPASVGKAIPNTETFVVDKTGNPVKVGEIGELVVRGSNIMLGYWNDTAATDRALRPGHLSGERLLYTGDLFRLDEEGYLYFVSRADELIKTRGLRVSPGEVEDVLYGIEGVVEAKVYGADDEYLGQMIRALVVIAPESTLTEQSIIQYCARFLEDYKVPQSIEFRSTLSKTNSGKIIFPRA